MRFCLILSVHGLYTINLLQFLHAISVLYRLVKDISVILHKVHLHVGHFSSFSIIYNLTNNKKAHFLKYALI